MSVSSAASETETKQKQSKREDSDLENIARGYNGAVGLDMPLSMLTMEVAETGKREKRKLKREIVKRKKK